MEESFEYIFMAHPGAGGCEELLDDVSDLLFDRNLVHESFREAVKERERLFPTGMNTIRFGVAMPHVEPLHVAKNGICVVNLEKPVLFGMMGATRQDLVPVECVLVLLLASRDHHAKTLVRFMDILRCGEDLENLRRARSAREVQLLLEQYI